VQFLAGVATSANVENEGDVMKPVILPVIAVLLSLGGCSTLASRVLPSNNQVLNASQLRAGAYTLDKEHVTVLFEVNHLGYSGYIGRFNDIAATLDFDPARADASVLDVQIASASVDTPSDMLDDKLRSSAMFDVAKHPLIRFQSRTIVVSGAARGKVTGDLTMNGITRPVTLDVQFNGGSQNAFSGKYTLGFHAHGTLDRTDWGLTAWTPAVGKDVALTIRAEFQKR
jgi:polyisoprenoid-binding protein YceI